MESTIVTISILLLTAIAGGLFIKLRFLAKQVEEFIDAISDALEDNSITKEELDRILLEARDIGTAAMEIAKLFNKAK